MIRPNLHLFGHTHIPIFLEIEGLKYLQWPLGYPKYVLQILLEVVFKL